ncbi:hypothetical protein E2C01_077120 [Portunus trituberculatus]|uniref:Uncharacterized protein n=1 Tax=Portunus trituberculatus TaxID=210409 RepID=A0A5B7IEZ8_PORTR|nr:hypothetical protein [Portunus trituberculatus]
MFRWGEGEEEEEEEVEGEKDDHEDGLFFPTSTPSYPLGTHLTHFGAVRTKDRAVGARRRTRAGQPHTPPRWLLLKLP